MILDNLINLILWVLNNWLLPLFPSNLPFLDFNNFVLMLENLKTDIVYAFSFLGKIFPIDLLLALILVVITAEILLFGFKSVMWIINIVRGAGA